MGDMSSVHRGEEGGEGDEAIRFDDDAFSHPPPTLSSQRCSMLSVYLPPMYYCNT